ncbi:MAG: hypothetical protein WCP18_03805 [bacterium]
MSKKLLIILPLLTIALAGCNNNATQTVARVADTTGQVGAAQQLTQDANNINAITSDANVENILTIMNYQGAVADRESMKLAIKSGMEAGKTQGELDKNIVTNKDLGAGYLLGYTFACKAVTGDETKCGDDLGQKYQTVMMQELQKQVPTAPIQ